MAGWTINRQAKRPPTPRRAPSDARADDQSACSADAPLTLNALLGAPQASPPRLVSSQQAHQLSRIVELEIIPRLMLMHRVLPLSAPPPSEVVQITASHVRTLATLAVDDAAGGAETFVRGLQDAGASHEQLLLELLAPCARWMGEQWEEDTLNFSQVTIGLWRLQRVLHGLSPAPGQVGRYESDSRRALLAAVPGAQHTFGVAMVAEFFTRAGWDVDCEPRVSWLDLRTRLSSHWFDLFGLSVATSDSIPKVASAILDIRKAAANPQLFVMVGGPMAAQMPELASLCGADAMASDAPTAVAAADASLRRSVKTA